MIVSLNAQNATPVRLFFDEEKLIALSVAQT